MSQSIILLLGILLTDLNTYSQNPDPQNETAQTEKDSIKKIEFARSLLNA